MALSTHTQRALLLSFIFSIGACGLIGIYVLLLGNFGWYEERILATAASIGGASILAMAGTFKVTFDFKETTAWRADYTPIAAKISGGHEVVRVIVDTGKLIVLQHILVVTDIQCRYRTPYRYDDEVLIRTNVAEIASRSIKFSYELYDAGGTTLHANGSSSHLWLDEKTRRPVRAAAWSKIFTT